MRSAANQGPFALPAGERGHTLRRFPKPGNSNRNKIISALVELIKRGDAVKMVHAPTTEDPTLDTILYLFAVAVL